MIEDITAACVFAGLPALPPPALRPPAHLPLVHPLRRLLTRRPGETQ